LLNSAGSFDCAPQSLRFAQDDTLFNRDIFRWLQIADPALIFAAVESVTDLKKTPLHDEHVRLGGKIVEFGGWSMPVQYTGIIDEHLAVRNAVGVFDISHMGQFFVTGPEAANWLNYMLTNNIHALADGQCQYTFLLNDRGGVIDDLIAYRLGAENFLLVVNAALIEKDFAWLQANMWLDVELENRSEDFAGLAVQGPNSRHIFSALFGNAARLPSHNGIAAVERHGGTFYIARTGYTGEDGFELFFPAWQAVEVWNEILEKGKPHGIKPCGLGARDTLRLEMCYPLNGSDLSPKHTPVEAGLSFFVDFNKPRFIGQEALEKQRTEGVKQKLIAFKMNGKTPPPRGHYPVCKNGEKISEIGSGSLSPSLNTGIGMAYIPVEHARIGGEIEIDIRGKLFPATIEKKPLLKK
jgi:aminomethyltransferase